MNSSSRSPLLPRFRSWIRSVFRRSRAESEMDSELRFHIEARADDLMRAGVPAAEALRRARLEFGAVDSAKEECREAVGIHFLETLAQDVRYGLRSLRKSPGFAAVAILTLALGIGAACALCSVIEGAFLRPFPYKNADRSVVLEARFPLRGVTSLLCSGPEFFDIRDRSRIFAAIAAEQSADFNLSEIGNPDYIYGARVTASDFPMNGVAPLLGRVFTPEEDRPGGPNVVVLSYDLWKKHFQLDPAIVGKTIRLNGESYAVIGVMPERYRLLGGELFLPLRLNPADTDRSRRSYFVVGHLRAGITLGQARRELHSLAVSMERENLGSTPEYADWTIEPRIVRDIIVGELKSALGALAGAVGLVLLAICANLANLFFARATTRKKEFALRLVHGASPARIVRQVMIEGFLLSVAGSALGFLIMAATLRELIALVPPNYIATEARIQADPAIFLFGSLVAFGMAIFFAIPPAWRASRTNVINSIKDGGRGASSDSSGTFLRSALVASEVALAAVVLVGAALMIRSFREVTTLPLGFDAANVLTMRVPLTPTRYPQASDVSRFFRDLVSRVDAVPGIEGAAATSLLPMETWDLDTQDFSVEGRPLADGGPLNADERIVSPEYFRVLRIPLLEGREFSGHDDAGALRVAIINRRMAQAYWPNSSPIGHRIRLGHVNSRAAQLSDAPTPLGLTIVGVVADARQRPDILRQIRPEIYLPLAQSDGRIHNLALAVRTTGSPGSFASAVRSQIASLDSQQPVYRITDMQHIVGDGLGPRRLSLVLLSLFAGLALVLVVAGVHGVINYSVSCRTREFGIRMALGAAPGGVLRSVVNQGLRLSLLGTSVGMAIAALSARLLKSQLYAVGAVDLWLYAAVAFLLLALAAVASCIPARRAMRVDPMVALRHE